MRYRDTEFLTRWPSPVMEIVRLIRLQKFRQAAKHIKLLVKKDEADLCNPVTAHANTIRGNDICRALKPIPTGGLAKRKGVTPLPGFSGNVLGVVDCGFDSVPRWKQEFSRQAAGFCRKDSKKFSPKSTGEWTQTSNSGTLKTYFPQSPQNEDWRKRRCTFRHLQYHLLKSLTHYY